jgi:HlyD family secretion protein
MTTVDPRRRDNGGGRMPPGLDSSIGPQGDALILELRRLQRALERNWNDEPGGSSRPRGTVRAQRPAASGRARPRGPLKTRNVVRRALARCLESIGLGDRSDVGDSNSILKFEQRRPGPPPPNRPETRSTSTPRVAPSHAAPPPVSTGSHGPSPPPPAAADVAPPELPPQASAVSAGLRSQVVAICERLQAGLAFVISGSRDASGGSADSSEFSVRIRRAYDGELRTALRVLLISIGLAGGWAILVPLSGAVVVPGTLVVESNVKKVQHPTGGIVADIPVHDGMRVNAGDLLVRLDETQVRAGRQVITNQLEQVRVRIARLEAERDDAAKLVITDEADNPLVTSEISLFNARASARHGQKELLQNNISQFEEQIGGLDAQIKSKSSQLTLISGELTGVQELLNKGLVPLTRVTTLQRESARLDGERGQLVAAIAETKTKIGQAQLQIVRIDQEFRAEVMKDLRESQDKEAELTEKSVAAQDQLNRVEIHAPTAGVIHQLSIHTIGGVIRPGDVIMEIVPDSDDLEIEARLPPQDIDQVRRAQTAYLRFSAFNQRTTPEVAGIVAYVSADLGHDTQTNASFYTVRITLPETERHRLAGLKLLSGMPVEVFLQTGTRTMASYLLKPISDQFHRMFNER